MNCAQSSQLVFSQIISILDEIKDEDYSRPLEVFNDSTIGKHFRHILDFYNCIFNGARFGELDYAKRDRSPSVESQTSIARSSFLELQRKLDGLDENTNLQVITDFHTDESLERPIVISSVGRELMYAYDHAIHHLAIIKIGIKTAFPYMQIENHIGVAPSTIKHESSQYS